MNPPELHDIHLPDASLWWPPAPGWWIAMLLLLLLALLLPRLLRWIRRQPLKRVSLRQLRRIRQEHSQGLDERAVLGEIAALLRRVTISYYGRAAAAAMTGEEWQRQLQRLAPGAEFDSAQLRTLTRDRYRADTEIDIESLLSACERWLRGLPRSRDHVSA
jgi:hypothetical protein